MKQPRRHPDLKFRDASALRMLILYDPAADLELPRLPQEIPYAILTEDVVWRLLNAPDLSSPVGCRDRAMVELFFATGLRASELIRLKVAAATVSPRHDRRESRGRQIGLAET